MQHTPPTRPLGMTRRRMALALPLLGAAAWLPSLAWASAAPAAVLRDARALMGACVFVLYAYLIVKEGSNVCPQ